MNGFWLYMLKTRSCRGFCSMQSCHIFIDMPKVENKMFPFQLEKTYVRSVMGEILKILRGLESTHPFSLLILDSSSEPRIKTTRDFLNNQFADLFLSPKHHQSGSQTQVEVYLRDMKRNKTVNLPTKNPIY